MQPRFPTMSGFPYPGFNKKKRDAPNQEAKSADQSEQNNPTEVQAETLNNNDN